MKVKYKFPKTAEDFLKFISTIRRPATHYSYSTALKQFHVFLKEHNVPLKKLRRAHIEKFMQSLREQGKSNATVSVRLVEVRGYLLWLSEMGYINENPNLLIKNTDFPKVPKRLPRPLPAEVDRILLKRLRKSVSIYHKGLLIQRLTGLRISELAKLEFDCVQENEEGTLLLKVPVGKLHNERLVPITEEIDEIINFCKKETYIISKHKMPPYLIASERTDFVCLNTYRRALFDITDDLKHLDSEEFSPHRLRHTYATELINAGMNLTTVMKLLGHRSPNMTLTYAYVAGETIHREYTEAVKNIKKNHKTLSKTAHKFKKFDPINTLSDLKNWLVKNVSANDKVSPKKLSNIIDRIRRLQNDLEEVLK